MAASKGNLFPPRRPLREVAEIFVGVPTKQSQLKEFGPSGNVLTVRALHEFGIDRKQLVRVEMSPRDVTRYQARTGDLLLSARSTVLKMGIVTDELDGAVVNATLMVVRPLPGLDARLLAAFLSHPEGQAALAAVAQSGTTQMNLTVNAVSKLAIPVLPIEVQRRLASLLEAADLAYGSAMAAAHARKALVSEAVMEQLLKGQLP